MKKERGSIHQLMVAFVFIVIALSFSFTSLFLVIKPTHAGGHAIVEVGSVGLLSNGIRVEVPIWFRNIDEPGIGVYSLRLTYDSDVMVVTAVLAGDVEAFELEPMFNISQGAVSVNGINPYFSGPHGDFVAANLIVMPIGEPGSSTKIHVTVRLLGDAAGELILAEAIDGEIKISPVSSTPTPTGSPLVIFDGGTRGGTITPPLSPQPTSTATPTPVSSPPEEPPPTFRAGLPLTSTPVAPTPTAVAPTPTATPTPTPVSPTSEPRPTIPADALVTSTPVPPAAPGSEGGLSAGGITSIVVGIVAIIAAVVVLFLWRTKRTRRPS